MNAARYAFCQRQNSQCHVGTVHVRIALREYFFIQIHSIAETALTTAMKQLFLFVPQEVNALSVEQW